MHASEMNKTGTRTQRTDCCADANCDSGLRNNYYYGKRLSPHSFEVEQKYGLDRRRLLNRGIHGSGVVYGYKIEADPKDRCGNVEPGKLGIDPGLALDTCGRELLQTEQTNLALEDLILVDEYGKLLDAADVFPVPNKNSRTPSTDVTKACWLLSAHYAEQFIAPVDVKGSCQCEHHEWDQICETVRYSLQLWDCDKCCCNFECELNCECGTEPCSDDKNSTKQSQGAEVDPAKGAEGNQADETEVEVGPRLRGGCRCLCHYSMELKLSEDCGPLCEIDEPCGKIKVDTGRSVALACVKVVWDPRCNRWSFDTASVNACGPRRLVKRNDLLFDLIRGCDLTRISKISWGDWHRKSTGFDDFSHEFGNPGQDQAQYVTNFSVEFSRPVRRETLNADCFVITVMSTEHEGGWQQTLRVPIVDVDRHELSPKNDDYVTGGSIVVDGSWVEDALRGRKTIFQKAETWVEIEVRGDYILDCNGQAVDANPIGLSPYPSGNGTPGGTFLSSFSVVPAEPAYKGAKS
jgi:hypothetical protein